MPGTYWTFIVGKVNPYIRVVLDQPLGDFGFEGASGKGSKPDVAIIFPKLKFAIVVDLKPVPQAVWDKGFVESNLHLYKNANYKKQLDGTKKFR